ncbi:MAG TPA: hypothetical protein VIW29_08190 [Polyangiaceae bacterium]
MSAPRRLIDDPEADQELRSVLQAGGAARPLDDATRRRLRSRVARASALPAVAAGWLFVKSAAAALGAVAVTGTVVSVTGILPWPSAAEVAPPSASARPALRQKPAPALPVTTPQAVEPTALPDVDDAKVNPTPSLPVATPSASGAGSLSAESTLLEQARREMRVAPALALQIAAEHARRFPRGQLSAERLLIQVEALHRLGRDAEARRLAAPLANGASGGLYRERVRQLLGESVGP